MNNLGLSCRWWWSSSTPTPFTLLRSVQKRRETFVSVKVFTPIFTKTAHTETAKATQVLKNALDQCGPIKTEVFDDAATFNNEGETLGACMLRLAVEIKKLGESFPLVKFLQ